MVADQIKRNVEQRLCTRRTPDFRYFEWCPKPLLATPRWIADSDVSQAFEDGRKNR